MARPTKYNKKVADKICKLIATTNMGLVKICKDKDMPSTVTVYAWLKNEKHKEFLNNYVRARETQQELLAEEILDIADNTEDDIIELNMNDGTVSEKVNHENIHRSRLRVDTRKWLLSKLNPKKYGDRIQTDINDITKLRKDVSELFPDQDELDEAVKRHPDIP